MREVGNWSGWVTRRDQLSWTLLVERFLALTSVGSTGATERERERDVEKGENTYWAFQCGCVVSVFLEYSVAYTARDLCMMAPSNHWYSLSKPTRYVRYSEHHIGRQE